MRNLLTDQTKHRLRAKYLNSLFFIMFLLLSTAIIIGAGALVPSYLLSQSRKSVVENKANLVKKGLKQREPELSTEALKFARSEIGLLSESKGEKLFSDRLRRILEKKPPGISITSFSYVAGSDEEGSLNISGTALSREDLLSLERGLKNEPDFTSVVLPVSNLAKEKDISFSLVIKGTF